MTMLHPIRAGGPGRRTGRARHHRQRSTSRSIYVADARARASSRRSTIRPDEGSSPNWFPRHAASPTWCSLNTAVMTGSPDLRPSDHGVAGRAASARRVLFSINAVSFMAILIPLAMIDRSPALSTAPAHRKAGHPVRDGLRYVRRTPIMFVTFIVFTIVSMLRVQLQRLVAADRQRDLALRALVRMGAHHKQHREHARIARHRLASAGDDSLDGRLRAAAEHSGAWRWRGRRLDGSRS